MQPIAMNGLAHSSHRWKFGAEMSTRLDGAECDISFYEFNISPDRHEQLRGVMAIDLFIVRVNNILS